MIHVDSSTTGDRSSVSGVLDSSGPLRVRGRFHACLAGFYPKDPKPLKGPVGVFSRRLLEKVLLRPQDSLWV